MSSSSLRKMRSRSGRGDAGESLIAQLPSLVAPLRYRGASFACSTRCPLTTPRSLACSAMPGLLRQFPGQSPWQTRSGQGTDAQLLVPPFLEQYGSLLPVGSRRRLNLMEPLRECVSMRMCELRWGRLLTPGFYDLVITESSLCRFMFHRPLEFPSCVLD